MYDRETVMSWLEGLAQDDWRQYHSDSEVQEIARNALALLLREQERGMTQSEYDFLDWLACSVVLADDFETNPGFYREIICRKLVRLGMLKLEDDCYALPDPSRWRGEETCIEEPDCRVCGQSKRRENRDRGGGGIKSKTKTTPATPKAPPPPKKRVKEDDRK